MKKDPLGLMLKHKVYKYFDSREFVVFENDFTSRRETFVKIQMRVKIIKNFSYDGI